METQFYYYDPAHPLKPFAYALPGQTEMLERVPMPPAPPFDENGALPEGWTPPEQQYEEIVHKLGLPDHALLVAPEDRPGFWPVLNAAGDGWEYVEDHRQHKDERDRVVEGTGTAYWLAAPHGEDDWQSVPRYNADIGPLPEGAVLTQPEKPLVTAQDAKRQEITRAHEAALAGSVALSDPTPNTVAVESALLAVQDAAGLEYVRDMLEARRAELLSAVDAAQSVEEVETISVSYPV